MKPTQAIPGTSDRTSTREELCQIIDVLDGMSDADTARVCDRRAWNAQVSETGKETLWLDPSSEAVQSVEDLDSLAEMLLESERFVN